jgi:hypothetical protein
MDQAGDPSSGLRRRLLNCYLGVLPVGLALGFRLPHGLGGCGFQPALREHRLERKAPDEQKESD